eukprot:scaffold5591_cov70-Skeletonema_dohrnii-CCMP3373.AAC.2
MFKWSSTNNSKSSRDREDCVGTFSDEGSYHSILKKATYSTGNTKGKKKKKKKNVDRSVTWSKEFQTYEERCPQSFDTDYDDDDYSYNRDDTFDDEEESLISGYLSEHAGDTNPKQKAGALSSMFAPIALPANFKMNSAPEDDALIETMDNYYSGIGKAASEEGSSIVSYDGMRDVSRQHRQREIDGNIGNLGLVMPSLDGFLNVLGVTSNSAEDATYMSDATSYSSSGSLSSEETEYTAEKKADKSRRTKSTATTKSRDKAGKDIRSSSTEKKVKDTRSAPIEKKVKDTQSAPTETKVKKKKAKSTAELNVAIQKLETNSSESTDSGIEVSHSSAQDVSLKFSGSDDVIKPLISDGVLESGNKSGATVNKSSKKKKNIFGLKNKRKGADKPEVDKLKSLEESTKNSVTTKVSPTPDVSDIEVQSLVEAALAQQKINDGSVERIKAEAAKRLKASAAAGVDVIPRAQIPGGTINQAEAAEVKQSFSASTDGGSETSEIKGKVKSTKKKSLKNKLSFRRNKSAFSGRELAFAYAQQQMAPLEVAVEEQEELYVGSSDEVVSVGGEEQKVLSAHSETKSNQQGASFAQESTPNYPPTLGIGEAMSYETANTAKVDRYKVPRKKLDAPKMVKKETAPLKKKQEPSAPKPGKEVKKPDEVKRPKEVKKPEKKVKVDQPTMEKKKKETAPMKKKEKPSTPKVVKEVKRSQEKPSAPKVAKEVKRPQEKAIVDLPETAPVKKTEPSPKRVKEPTEKFKFDLPLPKQSLYDNILAAESFDSVSTTEDILSELQEIEEAAMLMYQSMVTEGEYE